MRKNKTDIDNKASALLAQAAQEVASQGAISEKVSVLEQEIAVMKYTINNLLKVISDLPVIRNQVEQLDYRTLATLKVMEQSDEMLNSKIEAAAHDVRDEAFMELSKSDDEQKSLIPCDINADITEEHHIIFTTDCKDAPERGVFRSKVELKSEDFKEYKDSFIGKKVGDEFPIMIQGYEHIVTILGVRMKDANK